MRERDDDVKLEWWKKKRKKWFLTKVRRGKKDGREDRKCGPKIAYDFEKDIDISCHEYKYIFHPLLDFYFVCDSDSRLHKYRSDIYRFYTFIHGYIYFIFTLIYFYSLLGNSTFKS